MIAESTKADLAECARLLALNVAHYKAKYGELPLEEHRAKVWREDAQGNVLSSTCNEEWALPITRRQVYRTAHTRRAGTCPTRKPEAWFVFCRSQSREAINTATAMRQCGPNEADAEDMKGLQDRAGIEPTTL